MKALTLCADDYALSPPVSAGILALARSGRLQAVSCMTDSPRWAIDGPALADLPGVQVGLHLNFTEAFANAAPVLPLGRLIVACWLRRLDEAAVRASVQRQYRRFVEVMGRAPAFVDGHQHVHQFPQIREALLAELAAQGFTGWVRSLAGLRGSPGMAIKILILRLLGASELARRCHAAGLRSNPHFAGVYDFDPRADYRRLMRGWLRKSPDATLIMCHPAEAGAPDGIGPARAHELAYLQSSTFAEDCAAHSVQLKTLSEILHAQA
jgi:predicted glycoside hydrolase/deacetylase ChbG (UPF0249 family)